MAEEQGGPRDSSPSASWESPPLSQQYSEGNEGDGESPSRGELVVTSAGTSRGPAKTGKKSTGPRDGHRDDLIFKTSAGISPKLVVQYKAYADAFYEELVDEADREEYPRHALQLRVPGPDDRAHDSNLGMCIYWKMPKCGFKIRVSKFVREILRHLDVAPAQLTAPAWCYIMSFKFLFDFLPELKSHFPSVGLFFHYFAPLYNNESHLAIRKRGKVTLFDRLSKADDWNHGWVYLQNPTDLKCFNEIRRIWRPLKKESLIPRSRPPLTSDELKIVKLLDGYFTS